MFGKLKEKLKSSLSIFSKKTEEAVKDDEVIETTEQPAEEITEPKVEKREEIIEDILEEKEPEKVEEILEEQKKETEKSDKDQKEDTPEQILEEIEANKEKDENVELQQKEDKVSEKEPAKEKQTKTDNKNIKKTKEEKKGFFSKIKQSLTTKQISAEKFEDLFWDLELVLLESNVSVKVIEKIKEDLKEELVDKPLPRDVTTKIQEVLKTTLTEILSVERFSLIDKIKDKKESNQGPFIITFFGINGAGKTTSIAKLTHLLKENNLSVVLAACDTFRAAAIQQLEDHANKLNVKMIKHDYGSDAAAVAYDAVKHAEKNNIDVVLIDTAGRLHSNTNLMAELEKICRTSKPDLKIFVGESITGNDCIEQAEKFNELVELDAAVLTKADIDENGGAPLSIAYTIKKPILYLGMGQEYKDLEEFNPELILKRLGFE